MFSTFKVKEDNPDDLKFFKRYTRSLLIALIVFGTVMFLGVFVTFPIIDKVYPIPEEIIFQSQ